MKHLYKILLSIIGSIIITSCLQDKIDTNGEHAEKCHFTIAEAQAFWESSTTSRAIEKDILFNPSDYVPLWDKGTTSYNNKIANVVIPIQTQSRYRVLRSDFIYQNAQTYKVDITQKIIFSKNISNGKIGQYLITLIPDCKYYNKNKTNTGNQFTTLNAVNQYSGWIIYSLTPSNHPFKIEKYESGNKTIGIIIPRQKDKKAVSLTTIKKILGPMQLLSSHHVSSRSAEDYDNFFDWFEEEIWGEAEHGDHYTMEQEEDKWWIKDQDGNKHEVPEGLIDDNDIEIDDSNSDISNPDDSNSGDSNIGESNTDDTTTSESDDYEFVKYPLMFEVYHKPCNSYLGIFDTSITNEKKFYCSKCQKHILVKW